jgi:solute:Na+ symporter, SSS family
MPVLDYIIIFVFATGIVAAGISFKKTGAKNMKSFFAAGGAVPYGISGLSLFMSFFSAGTFVVWGAIAYNHGLVSISIQWTMCIAGLLIGFFIAHRWKRTRALTAAEYISQRFGFRIQKLYTYIFIFISLFTVGAFLYPVARIVSASTTFSLTACIIFLGSAIILYTTFGGLMAVVVTDVLQFIILTAAVFLVIPFSFREIGGVDQFFQQAPPDFFDFSISVEYTWPFLVAFLFYNLFFIGGNWSYVQKYLVVDSERSAKKVGWVFGLLYLISPVIWMLPPMIYRIYNPELIGTGAEKAYILMCKTVLPMGMLGLMLGAMLFATGSSVSTALNISAGVFTNDLYKNLKKNIGKTISNKELIKVGRIATVVFGGITILVALSVPYMGGIVNVVLKVASITGGALYLPAIWSLYSTRHTGMSLFVITCISLTVNMLIQVVAPEVNPEQWDLTRAQDTILGVSFPLFCLLVYELYAYLKGVRISNDYAHYLKWRQSKESIQLSEEEKQDVAKGNNYSLLVIGIGLIVTGFIISILGIIAREGALLTMMMGGLIIFVGLLIRIRAQKQKKKLNAQIDG